MERFWIDSTGEGLLNIMLLLEGLKNSSLRSPPLRQSILSDAVLRMVSAPPYHHLRDLFMLALLPQPSS
jgi:hypothetical protein